MFKSKKLFMLFALAGCSLTTAVPAQAHHSASSEFNMDKTITIKGVLTSVEWINPHAYLHFDVVGSDGKKTKWDMLLAGTNVLRKSGLASKDMLAVGKTYTLVAAPARQRANLGALEKIIFPDGRTFSILGDYQAPSYAQQ